MNEADEMLAMIQHLRDFQNNVITVYYDIHKAALPEQREGLPFDIESEGWMCALFDKSEKLVGTFRLVGGTCVLHWLRSYDDLMVMNAIVHPFVEEVA